MKKIIVYVFVFLLGYMVSQYSVYKNSFSSVCFWEKYKSWNSGFVAGYNIKGD